MYRVIFLSFLLLLAFSCARQTGEPAVDSPGAQAAAEKLAPLPDGVLFVSIPPQKYFLDRITGGRWDVEVMVPPGASPATYNPTPQQIMRLSKAAAYFRIGVPFEEAFLPNVRKQLPELEIVDTREGIDLRSVEDIEELEKDHHGEHEHDAEHDHDHHGDDPHIWLSPTLVKTQARTMTDWLVTRDPATSNAYRSNLLAFDADIDSLRGEVAHTLAPLQNRTLLVFHPSWGYFCDEFDLKQAAIETAGKSPTASPLAQVIDYARSHDIHVVFVQQQFSTAEAKAVAEAINGRVVSMDPLAEDWLNNLRKIARTVAQEGAAQ